jgi:hypothetical protein
MYNFVLKIVYLLTPCLPTEPLFAKTNNAMKRLSALVLCLSFFLCRGYAQTAQSDQHVFTSDIDHFWIAYDSAQTTADSVQQLHYVQTLYVDEGTPGLKAFMIRPNTLSVKSFAPAIEASKIPAVTRLDPFANGDSSVDPSLKELTIQFSMPMNPGHYSISSGAMDKDELPLGGWLSVATLYHPFQNTLMN